MLFQNATIKCLSYHTGTIKSFPSEHLLFSVKGSSGKLCMAWCEQKSAGYDHGRLATLLLNDTPLIQIQSSGCPTCESLLAAGYELPPDSALLQAVQNTLNSHYTGLDDALERLRPILELLNPGIYILSYSQYCPTDGDGNFFWNAPGVLTPYKATAELYHDGSYCQLPYFPYFLFPTQGTAKYNSNRAEDYRQKLQTGDEMPPVLAYYLYGYMSILLDGHHRASACALEGVSVPGLTISQPGQIHRNGEPRIIWPDGEETPMQNLLTLTQKKMLSEQIPWKKYNVTLPPASCHTSEWEQKYIDMARLYPTCHDAGALALYPGIELNIEGLHTMAMDDDLEDATSAAQLLKYASRQPGVDIKTLALAFIARGYPAQLRLAAFEVLDQIKNDPEIDDLMIDILINCERKDSPIYKIADRHWSSNPDTDSDQG